jgi:hypothetical protein
VRWVVGTQDGLVGSEGGAWLVGREVTALAPDGIGWLVLAEGSEVLRVHGDEVDSLGTVVEETGRCLQPVPGAVLVGTAQARLAMIEDGAVTMVRSFDEADGREAWYTPWGGPPDTRSLARSADGILFANVHVGGILRAETPEGGWSPTIDVDADVHQVLTDALDPGHVVAATALGLAESRDGGGTWRFAHEGLDAPYARAVALDGERLYLSASTGPRGGRAGVYRREPGSAAFEKCGGGLPEWFGGNVDSHRLAAAGGTGLFGTEDGNVFLSDDGGDSWRKVLGGSTRITCVGVAAA